MLHKKVSHSEVNWLIALSLSNLHTLQSKHQSRNLMCKQGGLLEALWRCFGRVSNSRQAYTCWSVQIHCSCWSHYTATFSNGKEFVLGQGVMETVRSQIRCLLSSCSMWMPHNSCGHWRDANPQLSCPQPLLSEFR